MDDAQQVLEDVLADAFPLAFASLLIEAEMNSAIYTGVRDVGDDRLEIGVMEDNAGHRSGGERQIVTRRAVETLQDFSRGGTERAVCRRIAGEARGGYQRHERQVRNRLRILVLVAALNQPVSGLHAV